MQTEERRGLLLPPLLLAGTGALEVTLLCVAGPPSSQLHLLAGVLSPMAEPLDGLIAALTLAAQALAAYLALALALRTLARLPGLAGHIAEQAAWALTIPAVRRGLDALVGGALIAQLALAPVGTGTGSFRAPPSAVAMAIAPPGDSSSPGHALPTAATVSTTPCPPDSKAPPSPVPLPIWLGAGHVRSESPAPSRPPGSNDGRAFIDATRSPSLAPPGADAASHAQRRIADQPSQLGSGRPTVRHTVEPGDTLWSIGASHLPARARTETMIARYWRRIYGANRDALGSDPGLIRPGVTLSIPPYARQAVPPGPDRRRGAASTWPRSAGRIEKPAPDRLP